MMKLTFFLSNTDALPESLVQNNVSGAHWNKLAGAEDRRATRPGHSAVGSSRTPQPRALTKCQGQQNHLQQLVSNTEVVLRTR